MCEALGYNVLTLRRTRIMNISLGTLPLGKWRNLSEAEVAILKASVADSQGTSVASPKVKRVPPKTEKPKEKNKPKEPILSLAKQKAIEKEQSKNAKKTKAGSFKDFRNKGKGR